MRHALTKTVLALGFAVAAVGLTTADDAKPAAKPATATDWTKFAAAGEAVGSVVTSSDDDITIEITTTVATAPKGKSTKPGVKAQAVQQTVKFADGGLVRWKKLPPKLDVDGKKASYSLKEMEAFKMPPGAPGYAAEKSEVRNGHIVQLQLVRPKDVPAAKATADDLRVKYAMIVGEDPTPPKAPKNVEGKKKKEK